jgi:hypothetical protein
MASSAPLFLFGFLVNASGHGLAKIVAGPIVAVAAYMIDRLSAGRPPPTLVGRVATAADSLTGLERSACLPDR